MFGQRSLDRLQDDQDDESRQETRCPAWNTSPLYIPSQNQRAERRQSCRPGRSLRFPYSPLSRGYLHKLLPIVKMIN